MKTPLRIAALFSLAISCALTASPGQADGSTIQLSDVSGEGYVVNVVNGETAVGAHGTVKVTIKATDGFKVNQDYPHKIKLADNAGVDFDKKTYKKGDGRFEGKKAFVFEIGATPKSAGSHAIEGKVKFSVCNDSQCKIKKVALNAKLTAG